MRDVDERDADLLLDLLQLDLHLLPELEVERAERFVEEQHLGLVDHRPGQSDPLALAAGQLVWPPVAEGGQTHHGESPLHSLLPGRPRHPLHLQAVADVLRHRHVGEEGVVLEHGVGVPQVRRHRCDVAAAELDPAGVWALESRDEAQQGRLPRARGAEQGEKLALVDDEIDTRDRDDLAVVLAYALELQCCFLWLRLSQATPSHA